MTVEELIAKLSSLSAEERKLHVTVYDTESSERFYITEIDDTISDCIELNVTN